MAKGKRIRYSLRDCPDRVRLHDPGWPESFSDWSAYADTKSKTHQQVKCPTCGFYAVWEPKETEG